MNTNQNRLFVDVHVIQTVPPSCMNRDDTGSPKTAIYGGVRRARVSSQSWKHAMRRSFQDHFDERELGVRTKKIVEMIAEEMKKRKSSIADAEKKAKEVFEKAIEAGKEKKKKENKSETAEENEAEKEKKEVLFFLSRKQAGNLAELAIKGGYSGEDAKAALKEGHGVDIALFGRMVADAAFFNVDASAQVAHSISTHRVDNEYDYFTAVDELAPKENTGAGMIGTIEYNSATHYRYSTIAAHDLFGHLGETEVTAKAIKEFVRAFILSMPTGKQNTFANRTLPDAVMITLRCDQPINLVGAFETPIIRSSEGGYAEVSANKLAEYAKQIYSSFAPEPSKSWQIGKGLRLIGKEKDLQTVLDEIEKAVCERPW